MLLCYVIEIDISDRVILAKGEVKEEIFCSIQVYVLLFIRVVSGQFIGLQHLRFELLLLQYQLLHDLLANVHSINGVFLRSLLVELLFNLGYFLTFHDNNFDLFNRVNAIIAIFKRPKFIW